MKKAKILVPVYGIKTIKDSPLQLDKDIILRNVKLLDKEHEVFKKHGLRSGYDAVLEIDYSYDEDDPSEPYPGISIRLLNMIDAAFVVYGEGKTGLAAIIPDDASGFAPFIISHANPSYEEYLNIDVNADFVSYYANFKKAYDMRPMAFDIFRRSQERFSNNDRTIDSCTVLESILVPKGERSKKSFILSGLKIMGYEKEVIERIEKLIDYRNAIIHADRDKLLSMYTGSVFTHSWFEETFKFVREILFRYVEKPWD